MPAFDKAVALVAPHCDIVARLQLVPPSATVRGIFFRNFEKELERHDKLRAYEEIFPDEKHSALSFYPMADFLVRQAIAGALVASPERVHEGMFLIAKGNAMAFMDSMLGRIMLRVLSRDPVRVCQQGLAARRQSFSYGHWELRPHGPNFVEMFYENEYLWIESAVAGGAAGSFEACGVKAQLETQLIDRFNGSTLIRW
jgi:uncharacterized protein (TIGR02265 family)